MSPSSSFICRLRIVSQQKAVGRKQKAETAGLPCSASRKVFQVSVRYRRLRGYASFLQNGFLLSAYCLLPAAFRLLPSAFCVLPSAFCLLLTAFRLLWPQVRK